MPGLGKVDRSFFEDVIYPNLGAERDDVVLGPTHGVDFGVLNVGGEALVVATDPVSVLPALGFERAGRLALDVVLADVAVSGIAPTHLTVSLSLPSEMTDGELAATWEGIAARAAELDVSIVGGHTARYPGVEYSWVGGATAIGVGSFDDIVRPDGARPGDALVVTTGPGAEVAGLFAAIYPDRLDLASEVLATARDRLDEFGVVRETGAAVGSGDVSAMHDATEGGLVGALVEMARGAGVRFDVRSDDVPLAPGVSEVTDALDVDPWEVTSTGTLVLAVERADARDVVDAIESTGTRAAVVGSVSDGTGVYVDGEPVTPPASDPIWDVFARFES